MTISILGCGWLGLPLAQHLIRRNHSVKGSTTTKEKVKALKNRSIEPYVIELSPEIADSQTISDFWKSDTLVLNIPPGRKRENIIEYHSKQIHSVIDHVKNSSIKFIVFISSTSVYPDNPGVVQEQDTIPGEATRESGNALLRAEDLLMASDDFETTVLRFGGLYGRDRNPAKYMAGRKNLEKANAPVNLIHRDDCIAIIAKIIEEKITGEIFNAICDGHPTRKEYYTAACRSLGLEPPSFKKSQEKKQYKVVSNEKLKSVLQYEFIHPEPLIPEQE
ncbi:MAG: SDR family oxidoreductase [Balneolaceae bacterium]|nr:SDR family oxidoreductase [Balneolaceae bacterium]